MAIKVSCECGRVTNVPDAYAGRTGKCPACKRPVKVPALPQIASAQPVSAEPESRTRYESEPESNSAVVAEAPAYETEHEDPALAVATAEPAAEAHAPAHSEYEPDGENFSEAVASSNDDPSSAPGADGEYTIGDSATAVAVQPLQYLAPAEGDGGPIAPPPSDIIQIPTVVPEKLRRPDRPPIFLVISAAGADVHTDFDASPVLATFVETFAKRLKKKFDVRLDPPMPDAAAPVVFVRVIRIHQGNRWLRYFLGLFSALFGAGTCVEIDGNVQGPSRQPRPFKFKHRCMMGVLGGGSLNLLKVDARVLAKKVARLAKKAGR